VERSFAHVCETGGARRSWLHGLEDVTKRYLMYAAGKNLGVLMRALFGMGKPRTLQTEGGDGFSTGRAGSLALWRRIAAVFGSCGAFHGDLAHRLGLDAFMPRNPSALGEHSNPHPICVAA